ncbi:MAG: tetratricopeptide repeat protein [Rhodomicrobiaceae bacterium]
MAASILMALQRDDDAAEACRAAIALDPGLAEAHSQLGEIMLRKGRVEAAERSFGRAVKLDPELATAHAGHAESLAVLGRLDEAAAVCDAALRLDPELVKAIGAKGFILHKQGKTAEALAAFDAALKRNPGIAMIHVRRGNLLHEQGRSEDALAAYDRAIGIEPEVAEFHCNRALALQALGRLDDAFGAFSCAIALKPDFAEALARLGVLHNKAGRHHEAIAALERAVELAPESSAARLNLAGILKERERYAEAATQYQALLRLGDAPNPAGLFEYCHLRQHLCDWNGLKEDERLAVERVKASGSRVSPFGALAMSCLPEDQLALARLWASGFRTTTAQVRQSGSARSASGARRIRLGYLSSDFYDHATASLVAELFERHDRGKFEIFGYCYSRDDGSAMRRRLVSAFDRFIDLRERSHLDAAQQIAGDGIDILIDLKGYTRGARSIIPAQRPAPIQVNYLGYPGTMGAPFMDYIIADPFVAPIEHQRFFDEKIVHLPDCYQPNDRKRRTASEPRTRADYGLPETGFVFCAFNNTYKITPEFFSVWMRLLGQIDGSVLWLLDTNETGKDNLYREAAARGIEPDRFVFAPRLQIAQHQARYAFADLFLDNLPVCAHTTASEALWAGLPIVTCAGDIFAGRVAFSLLMACGLPQLVTRSIEEYEALALRLAADRAVLAAMRKKLLDNRDWGTLFDTARYTRNLEAAFVHMVRLHEAGRRPEPFAVADLAKS